MKIREKQPGRSPFLVKLQDLKSHFPRVEFHQTKHITSEILNGLPKLLNGLTKWAT